MSKSKVKGKKPTPESVAATEQELAAAVGGEVVASPPEDGEADARAGLLLMGGATPSSALRQKPSVDELTILQREQMVGN